MQTITEFFEDKAKAFSKGDINASAHSLRVPAKIAVGSRTMVLQTHADVRLMVEQYRNNLLVEGFQSTECEIHHIAMDGDTVARVLLDWVHRNSRGAEIGRVPASYFCERNDQRIWEIVLVEVVTEAQERHASGLPIQ